MHERMCGRVIKLSKLTKADRVYRGISGMALPAEFWKANEFGVCGGIENAFMSTTVDRSVAMHYAGNDKTKPGIVFEVQQGMVNRGANVQWLSQFPHEEEVGRCFACAHTHTHCSRLSPWRRVAGPLWPADRARGTGQAG